MHSEKTGCFCPKKSACPYSPKRRNRRTQSESPAGGRKCLLPKWLILMPLRAICWLNWGIVSAFATGLPLSAAYRVSLGNELRRGRAKWQSHYRDEDHGRVRVRAHLKQMSKEADRAESLDQALGDVGQV